MGIFLLILIEIPIFSWLSGGKFGIKRLMKPVVFWLYNLLIFYSFLVEEVLLGKVQSPDLGSAPRYLDSSFLYC